MTRSAIIVTLIGIWLFAIVAPSVISLVNNGESIIISLNLNEEEQQEQSKKDDKEEKILLENWLAQTELSQQEKSLFLEIEKIIFSANSIEIPLPPPEFDSYPA
jgi:hypothetical protein